MGPAEKRISSKIWVNRERIKDAFGNSADPVLRCLETGIIVIEKPGEEDKSIGLGILRSKRRVLARGEGRQGIRCGEG